MSSISRTGTLKWEIAVYIGSGWITCTPNFKDKQDTLTIISIITSRSKENLKIIFDILGERFKN